MIKQLFLFLTHTLKQKFGLFFAKINLEERIIDEIEKRKGSFAEELCARHFYQKSMLTARALWEILSASHILVGGTIVKIRARIKGIKIDQIEQNLDEKFNFNKEAKAIQQANRKKVPATQ